MTDIDNSQGQGASNSFFTKLVKITAVLVFLVVIIIFGGFYLAQQQRYNKAQKDLQQFDGIEEQIFVAQNQSDNQEQVINLENFDVNDKMLQQVVMVNSNKIKDLHQKLEVFEQGFKRFESSVKLQQAIISYVKFREKFNQDKEFDHHLENFKLLIAENKDLVKQVRELERLLSNFKSFTEIKRDLKELIVDLTAMKKHDPDSGIIDKIRFSFAKLISIRKLDQFDQSIDGFIYRINEALERRDCQAIKEELKNVDSKYRQRLSSFESAAVKICEIKRIDGEIFEALEGLGS